MEYLLREITIRAFCDEQSTDHTASTGSVHFSTSFFGLLHSVLMG
jgi:hypothetical protein